MGEDRYAFSGTPIDLELERLTAVQDVFDSATHRYLEHIGLDAGWICLEVGAGAGSIMKWLCDRVGTQGQVVAVDRDPRFIATAERPNLEIHQLDITTTDLDVERFDLVHVRFVLMHILQQEQALVNMLRSLKPGGWLLVEEPDFAAAMPTGDGTAEDGIFARIFEATRHLYLSRGADPFLGRKLPLLLQQEGLGNIDSKAELGWLRGGSTRAKIWRLAVQHLRQSLIETGIPSEADLEQFIHLTQRSTAWAMDYSSIAVWGQKTA
jgi:SAM-dependent methyltransferase